MLKPNGWTLFFIAALWAISIQPILAQEAGSFLLTCEGEALVAGQKKPVKLAISKIGASSKVTTKEDDYSVLVDLAAFSTPPDTSNPAASAEHNIKENLQSIEFSTKGSKDKWAVDLRLVPEFDIETGALARMRIHSGLVKSSASKTALEKRTNANLGSLKNTYETFVGVSLEAVPTNFTSIELYPHKGLAWVGITCEVM
ncbi:MAG TPA: hypothetical protein PLH57_03320 [Oligoflexia bacterium]|nr:hypothetical protein [Oligoflexia bacterium]